MSIITIQCRLGADVATRQHLWQLMAELNTPLINEVLQRIQEHPDFETWQEKGKLKAGVINALVDELKQQPDYQGQPARFYQSAIITTEYMIKSWLKLRQRLIQKQMRQQRYLEILKSDVEFVEISNTSLDIIRNKSAKVLEKYSDSDNLLSELWKAYNRAKEGVNQIVLAYLIKHSGKIPKNPEDAEKFAIRRRKQEIKLERIQSQLAKGRFPQGRSLSDQWWFDNLAIAPETAFLEKEEFDDWQRTLLSKPLHLPFPVTFETNEDLRWSKNEKGRLCVAFNGVKNSTFEIYCDQRQLRWFQRFWEDQEIKRNHQNRHSSALFTLRSGKICWREGSKKGTSWENYHIYLHCSLDTKLWTQEGTQKVQQEKAEEIANFLNRMNEKQDDSTKNLESFLKRKQTTLERIANPFPRPSSPLYQGSSHILVGVAMNLEKPVTLAIVNAQTGKTITYRNLKQLLGNNYSLLNRQRQLKQQQSQQRKKSQQQEGYVPVGDSNLGEYINRLLSKAILKIAQEHQAGSIVIPDLKEIRETIQSELQARAEQKIPHCQEAQKQYMKRYRTQVHQWSHGQLISNLQGQASKLGIVIEVGHQCFNTSPFRQADELAMSAYHARLSG